MKFKGLIFLAIFALAVMGLAVPQANAQDGVVPYANAKMWTGVTMTDKDIKNPNGTPYRTDDEGEAVSDTDLIMGITPQTTIGVRGTVNNVTVDLSLMAGTPFGTSPADPNQAMQFIVAIMYNVGEASLMIGQHFGPYDIINPYDCGCFAASTGWDFLVGYAFFDAVREQIRVNYKGFYVGLFQNTQNESADADVLLPMIAAGYEYGNPGTPMTFSVHGLYQTYKNDDPGLDTDGDGVDDTVNPIFEETINSYGVVGKFGMNMAPISFYVSGLYGVNSGNMGFPSLGSADTSTGEVKDTTAMAGHGAISYTTGAITASIGGGYRQLDYDLDDTDPDKQMSYYVSVKYAVQPNFTITPIVLIEDRMKDKNKVKEGKRTVIGALFEANI